jgi:preprotein translocase subunit Sec63
MLKPCSAGRIRKIDKQYSKKTIAAQYTIIILEWLLHEIIFRVIWCYCKMSPMKVQETAGENFNRRGIAAAIY